MEKKCSKCELNKPLNQYYRSKSGKDGHHHYCKSCHSEDKKIRYRNNPSLRLKEVYGLTIEEYNNMMSNQKNSCKICFLPFKNKRTTFVDHDHKTGKVRGLLCPKCNNILGFCNDNTEILNSAIKYLSHQSC